jgi:large subunit ribosomal protein L24
VLEVIARKQRVLIEGVRMIQKHLKKSQDNPQGKIAGWSDPHLERPSAGARERAVERKGSKKKRRRKARRRARPKGRGIAVKNDF